MCLDPSLKEILQPHYNSIATIDDTHRDFFSILGHTKYTNWNYDGFWVHLNPVPHPLLRGQAEQKEELHTLYAWDEVLLSISKDAKPSLILC